METRNLEAPEIQREGVKDGRGLMRSRSYGMMHMYLLVDLAF
jgi:hypothetical protein